jgi:hypothetical protein
MATLGEQFEARVREIATEEIGRHVGVLEQHIEEAIQRAMGQLFGPAKPAPAAQRRRPGRPRKAQEAEPPKAVPVAGARVVEANNK